MTTIRKSQRTATNPKAGKPAEKLGSKPAAPSVGHPDVSDFTPARSHPLQKPASATVSRISLSAQAQGGGAAEPARLRTTDHLNLRRTANTDHAPITTLAPGTELEVTPDAEGATRKNGFVHVTWNDKGVKQAGWVAEQFTTPVAPTGPVSPGTTPGASAGLTIPQVDLQVGATGLGVRQLQECLVKLGHMTQEQVATAAGTFDATTRDALKAFQAAQGIEPAAGYFGSKTRATMHQALGLPTPLGSLSQKYESSGDAGAVSSGVGDPGGVSYGAYQFATNPGSAQTFVNWLADTFPDHHAALAGKTPGTAEFSAAWRELAARDPSGFLQAQHDHIQSKFYEPAQADVARVLGLDVSARSQALQDALWSTAVQHGPGGALKVFQLALAGGDVSQMSDADIIRALYAERGRKREDGVLVHFSNSSPAVQQSVAQRFIDEERDALAMWKASEGR